MMLAGHSIAIIFGLLTSISFSSLAKPTVQPSSDGQTSGASATKRPAMSQEAQALERRIVHHEAIAPNNYEDCKVWQELNSKFVEMAGFQLEPDAKFASICSELVLEEAKQLSNSLIDSLADDKEAMRRTHDILKGLADLKKLSEMDPRVQPIAKNHRLYTPIHMIVRQVKRLTNLQKKQGECSRPEAKQEPKSEVEAHEEFINEDEHEPEEEEEEEEEEPEVTSQETKDLLKELQANVMEILLKDELDEGDDALLKYYYDESARLIRDFWHGEPMDSGLLGIIGTLNAALHQINMPAALDDPDE